MSTFKRIYVSSIYFEVECIVVVSGAIAKYKYLLYLEDNTECTGNNVRFYYCEIVLSNYKTVFSTSLTTYHS